MMLIYDMEIMSKVAMVDLRGLLSQHLPGDTKGTEENLSQDAGCSVTNSKLVYPNRSH
jgi:hypothetical protein